ncbi:hypothetical protein PUNSTDRAFT_103264 [Punctularia strigosozonata HHB-11173 SS5]|uniref:uncharacterized protein n=1 Tax=Punctularia strigosozonata (strain HHB-11173) TaxID=741275 RepID=UPI00044165CD|nr:uncharacterized protein PUNSTDRAFT_103264 [Punctularia strigosozonata HHB-11173 SS5]EIN08399.1 hypothetical protein PUNSTDRAFT_103264 [Punctularia strigosozonata HHB-11173 SS5]
MNMARVRPVDNELITTVTRPRILASYWAIILLAVPLWWWATSIERLSLPEDEIWDISEQKLRFPIHLALDPAASGIKAEDQAVQRLRARLQQRQEPLELQVDANALNSPNTYHISVDPHIPAPILQGRDVSLPDTTALERLSELFALYPEEVASHGHRVAQYAPRYRLAFSLLNEDAAEGKAALTWDVRTSITQHLEPILERLRPLHNFTIESQIRFHAPLAITPQPLVEGYGINPEDLAVFVNSAEWTLSSSVSNDPVLHFILFIPSATRRPLHILDSNGSPSKSSAFILPQWGGIVIFNPPTTEGHFDLPPPTLDAPFSTFRYQLLSLLGVPPLPPWLETTDAATTITDWQLDTLLRRRALENVKNSEETLQSIAKLVHQIDNMPIGPDVRGDVQGALNALEKVYALRDSPSSALAHSAEALTLSSRAFFNPGMLALLYFPAEHKYAVYMPLFVPISVPLIAAAGREFRRWKKERRERRARQNVAEAPAEGTQL